MIVFMLVVMAKMVIAMGPFPTREACEAAGRDFISLPTLAAQDAKFECKPVVVGHKTAV